MFKSLRNNAIPVADYVVIGTGTAAYEFNHITRKSGRRSGDYWYSLEIGTDC